MAAPRATPGSARRHRQYLADTAPGGVFTITVDDDRGGAAGVGWAGYWELEHHDRVVWEAGLSVLTAWQGHGIGSTAFHLILERAAAEGRHRFMHAFPHVDNAASNRMCAGVGFELVDETDIEYSKGHWIRCNDWRYALWSEG